MTQPSWFSLFTPTIQLPASGDVDFNYAPYTKWEAPAFFRGNEQVETRAYSEVASPGRQLGWLMEAVLALAAKDGIEGQKLRDMPALSQLKDCYDEIEKIKAAHKEQTEKHARELLNRLKEQDPDLLKRVIDDYQD